MIEENGSSSRWSPIAGGLSLALIGAVLLLLKLMDTYHATGDLFDQFVYAIGACLLGSVGLSLYAGVRGSRWWMLIAGMWVVVVGVIAYGISNMQLIR